METIFKLKNELSFDKDIFEQMRKSAADILITALKYEYTQAIVLLSSKGNEYAALIKNALSKDMTDESSLLATLSANNDTTICHVLCMWNDSKIDLPSYKFRKTLCELDTKNHESGIFVKTKDGYSVIKLSTTLK